jgi:hypothetical protein
MNKINRFHVLVGGGFTYLMAAGAGYLYANSLEPKNKEEELRGEIKLSDEARNQTYSAIASRYDADIGLDETFMGLTLIRWWHLRKAEGNILEVGK